MTEKKFKEAKDDLTFSQNLLDQVRGQNMAQQSPEMGADQDQELSPTGQPTDAPVAPQEAPQQAQEPQDIGKAVQDAMSPYMEEIKAMLEKQSKETKQVEVKIEGEMSPKEGDGSVAKSKEETEN